MKNFLLLLSICLSCAQLSAQGATGTTIYLDFDVAHSATATGTVGDPYGDILQAIADAAANAAAVATVATPVTGEVVIKDKTYDLSQAYLIPTAATEIAPVVVKPQSPYGVTINFTGRRLFVLQGTTRYLTFEGLNLYGKADQADFWTVVAKDLWAPDGNPVGVGGLAFILDGEYLTVKDNYIHHFYQKAVEINDGRHLVIKGNIIDAIATNSLSGGHGIMRQQVGQELMTDDDTGVYRWDIYGNAIFNVEQRIYSWVPNKGFLEMVIDEGKSILIDDPQDSDGDQEEMSARIAHNIVAFGVVDHLRLKSTPNLEVSHNSVYSDDEFADGITDKIGDKNSLGNPSPSTFVGFKCLNNAVQMPSNKPRWAFDVKDATTQGGSSTGFAISGNYAGAGSRTNEFNDAGIETVNYDLFTNPLSGDFSLSSSAPAGIGVDPAILTELGARAAGFGVTISDDPWKTDDLLLTQTIMDNMPNVYDGIDNNETVMSDYGTIHFETETTNGILDTVEIDVTAPIEPGTTWRSERIRTNSVVEEKFVFGPIYMDWYIKVLDLSVVDGAAYDRIRYGDTEIRQTFIMPADWLMVTVLESATESTLMNAPGQDITTNGDLLLDFKEGQPTIGDSWTIMTAASITASPDIGKSTDFFENVLINGATLAENEYTIEKETSGGAEHLVLTIEAALPVDLANFTATPVGNKIVKLEWTTESEQSSDFFAVERSANGSDWQELGRVDGRGDYTGTTNYELIDNTPVTGLNYYRLRPTNFDGTSTFSNVEIVEITGEEASFRAFPNPAEDIVTLRGKFAPKDLYSLDALGRDVTARCNVKANDQRMKINVSELPTGIYHFVIGNESVKVSVR